MFIMGCGSEVKKPSLRFREDGKLKILQITDTHLDSADVKDNAETYETLRAVIEQEKPDVMVLTGDIIWHYSFAPWKEFADFIDSYHTPWCLVMGNHDHESGEPAEIFKFLETYPYFVGSRGPEDIDGEGNYVLPVTAHDGDKPAALLYCFDSHCSSFDNTYGLYDWIHDNQIQWYRHQSASFTAANGGKPLPALAFFHIPLEEHAYAIKDKFMVGGPIFDPEDIGGKMMNSGVAVAFAECGDVKGAFVGHSHDNDFIGLFCDIAMGFGRCSGRRYGEDLGVRVIELYESPSAKFDTWIRTPTERQLVYYYPSAINGEDESSLEMMPALDVKPVEHGLAYDYWKFSRSYPKFDHSSAISHSTGTMKEIDLPDADHYMYEFRTIVDFPESGVYRIKTVTDDESQLFIDGKLVVLNMNEGGFIESEKVALEKGFHEVRIVYCEYTYGQQCHIFYSTKDTFETEITPDMMYLPVEGE